jgi:hypothetical protein
LYLLYLKYAVKLKILQQGIGKREQEIENRKVESLFLYGFVPKIYISFT